MPGSATDAARLSQALDQLDDRFVWDAERMLVKAVELGHHAQDLGDAVLIARADLTHANLRMRAGDLQWAAREVPKIHERAAGLNSPALLARTHVLWAAIHRHLGDASKSLEHAVLGVELLDETATDHMQIWHRAKLGDALSLNGSLEEARGCFEKATDLALQKDLPELALAVMNNYAYAACSADQQDLALQVTQRLRDLAAEIGYELAAPMLDTVGTVEIASGEFARAERTLLACLDQHALNQDADADALPEYLLTLARAQRGLGAYERARANLETSHRLCSELSLGQVLVKVYEEQAELHAAEGDFEQAFAAHRAFFDAYVEMRSQQDEARARTRHAMLGVTEARQEADLFQDQARRDPLTGLRNRRYVDEHLPGLLESGQPLTVGLLDLDYFKRINDLFSHDTGDQVLMQVAALMQAPTQELPGVFAARLGGEEFLLVLPDVSPQQAYEVLEGVRRAVSAHPWARIRAGLQVTISIGGAWHPGDGPTVSQRKMLSTADRLLYAAKHTGRNRVVHDLPLDSAAPVGVSGSGHR